MLSSVLKSVRNLAENVDRLPDLAGAANDAKGQANHLTSTVLPKLEATQHDIEAYAASTISGLEGLAASLAQGSVPADLITRLQDIGQGCAHQRDSLGGIIQDLNRSRSGFASDYGALINQQTELKARIAGLSAQRNHWAEEADQLRNRNIATTVIGIFIPLVKLADELASLIQYRKTTEAALADASSALADTMHQADLLDMAVNQISVLLGLVDQLVSGVQHLDNAMNMVAAQLDNESHMANAATPASAGLFTQALKRSIGQLQAEAA